MSKRLLVVEDEPSVLQAIALCLRTSGYDVITARSGSEALIRIAEALPDLIISDIRMPGVDGYTLARQLRDTPRTRLIPIVFLSAKDRTEDRIEGFRSGVDAYLVKPFEPDELIAVVDSILKRVQRTHSDLARLIGETQQPEETFYDEDLTESEARIAEAVARGQSNKEIARDFNISVRTVENHISHIFAKKSLSNRVEIARYVMARTQLK